MASARVSLVHPGTGLRRETETSSFGVYHIGEVPIGECYLEVSAAGFRTVRTKSFVLEVGETRSLDVTLEIAAVGSTVEVQDAIAEFRVNRQSDGEPLLAPVRPDSGGEQHQSYRYRLSTQRSASRALYVLIWSDPSKSTDLRHPLHIQCLRTAVGADAGGIQAGNAGAVSNKEDHILWPSAGRSGRCHQCC